VKIRAHGVTHVGLVRNQNEDSLLIDEPHAVFAVADGVGGMPGGDVASASAVTAVKTALARDATAALSDLRRLADEAHRAVRKAADAFPGDGIATTFTLAAFSGDRVRVVHIGDSFAILVRDGRARAITREHNVENERADVESLSPYPSRYRYALTRVLGQLEPLVADVFEETLRPGDRLVVATDGLTDMVDMQDIAGICAGANDAAAATKDLLQAALDSGGHDNVTLAVVLVDTV
jgi:protein phosphatase